MSHRADPPRLMVSERADSPLRQLLEAGRGDAPSRRALRAAPAAVLAMIATQAGAGTAAAALGAGSAAAFTQASVGGALVVKWLTIGVVLGSALSVSVIKGPRLWQAESTTRVPPAAAPSRPTRSVALSERQVDRVFADQRVAEPTASATARVEASKRGAASAPASNAAVAADLAREIALLDAASRALAANLPERALHWLDGANALPSHSLGPEATVLRVRALVRLGRRESARGVVEAFAERAPRSPQLPILRDLVSGRSIP